MGTVRKRKDRCGYTQNPELPVCSNCLHFSSEMGYPAWVKTEAEMADFEKYGAVKVEKNMRCNLNEFAVKKMAACNSFKPKEREED